MWEVARCPLKRIDHHVESEKKDLGYQKNPNGN